MSSDNVFAAQMWTWPGPMLKRDPSGRVTVVNAAFLQMYGGSVEAWTGNTVTGWPAPQPPGKTTRFEARMPQADGSEAVYDWIEVSIADGSCLAIARDVTSFMQAPAALEVKEEEKPVEMPPMAMAQGQSHQQTPPPAAQEAPVRQEPPAAQTIAELVPAQMSTPETAPPPQTSQPAAQAPETPAAPATPQTPAQEPAQQPPAPVQEHNEPERDFERRALPIENGDSVLGNNWRDAVIAKAVGIEDTAEPQDAIEAETPLEAEDASDTNSASGTKILLAEDNAINALLTRTLLEAEGCIVEVVEDGALAVEAVRKASYDMIFMDMRMPNMDGLEATRKIRAMDHRSKGLPIVALTANAFDDDRNACFDSGMNDFMTKPVSAEELSEMVNTHTGKTEERLAS